ncbi:MAG TPA: ABC transporter ATP-binding protein [Polyangiaceae bacterium]|nr:ABC transporter ATP-binding protein [Polyangiaceae bacterium]
MNVSVKNVTKRFTAKGTPAVFDASFTATSGAITTLLGPSGSGKTTLLRVVAGLEVADQGQVFFDDRDVSRVPARSRGIGFVFQAFALFNHMTVRRNVAYALEVRGASEEEKRKRVAELLALVQLEGYADRYPRQLSGGQRQRVGFARALACRPSILLLDEPFGALDARVRVELREWLMQLHETTKLTTILVTHDQDEALELSAQIVVMDQGRVVQVGSPSDVYDRPRTPFVASFVGTANVLRGRVEGERVALGSLSVSVPSGTRDGAEVRAIVRPHDVRLAKNDGEQAGRSLGTITRMVGLGAHVKLQLELPSHDPVTVQLTRGEADAMGLAVGDKVVVDLAEAKVFVEDYSI